MLHFLKHICEYTCRMTWSIHPSNQNCNTHTLVSKSKNIINCTGILCLFFQCVLTSWILTTVTRDNYWPLVTIAVSIAVSTLAVCDLIHARYHMFWFWNTINLLGDMNMLDLNMQSCSCYPLQTTCMKCRYCFSAKIVTRVNLLPRLQNVVVHDLFKYRPTTDFKMATRRIFADRWEIIIQFNKVMQWNGIFKSFTMLIHRQKVSSVVLFKGCSSLKSSII